MATSAATEATMARLLERTERMLNATVDEVMTTEVITVDYHDFAAKAARLILDNGFMGVLIMKEGKPYNMVTATELLRLGYEEVFDPERDFLRLHVGDLVADKKLVSVKRGAKLRDLLNIILEQNVRTVPVIDEGIVHGIVSLLDMVRWYRETHDEVRTGHL